MILKQSSEREDWSELLAPIVRLGPVRSREAYAGSRSRVRGDWQSWRTGR